MNDELIEWLLSSLPGETAVAPFTTMIARDDEFGKLHEALRLRNGVTVDWPRRRISLESHGSIDFVAMTQGPSAIKGRLWNHSFELQGPPQLGIDNYDFMQTLSRRVERPQRLDNNWDSTEVVTIENYTSRDGDTMSIKFKAPGRYSKNSGMVRGQFTVDDE